MYKNLNYLNFTKNELKVILFILIVLFSGFSIKYIKFLAGNDSKTNFDYTQSEEIFKKLSKGSVNSVPFDSLEKKDSINISVDQIYQRLRATEDSLKSKKEKKVKRKKN
jgi:hypothetical protein